MPTRQAEQAALFSGEHGLQTKLIREERPLALRPGAGARFQPSWAFYKFLHQNLRNDSRWELVCESFIQPVALVDQVAVIHS